MSERIRVFVRDEEMEPIVTFDKWCKKEYTPEIDPNKDDYEIEMCPYVVLAQVIKTSWYCCAFGSDLEDVNDRQLRCIECKRLDEEETIK